MAWRFLEKQIKDELVAELDLAPDFQRAHVWTEEQQISYCEYILRGGTSGKDLYFNCKGFEDGSMEGPYVIVDGKQRLQAVRQFMAGNIPVFGRFIHEYEDHPDLFVARFHWNVAALETRKEVLDWYLNFNSGGTVHSEEELQKVRDMLDAE